MRLCTECSTANEDTAQTCRQCGAPLAPRVEPVKLKQMKRRKQREPLIKGKLYKMQKGFAITNAIFASITLIACISSFATQEVTGGLFLLVLGITMWIIGYQTSKRLKADDLSKALLIANTVCTVVVLLFLIIMVIALAILF